MIAASGYNNYIRDHFGPKPLPTFVPAGYGGAAQCQPKCPRRVGTRRGQCRERTLDGDGDGTSPLDGLGVLIWCLLSNTFEMMIPDE